MAALFEGMEDPTIISFRDPQQNGRIVEFVVDVTKTINSNVTAQVTRFPVEKGADITDHVQPEARNITLNCFVSITPTNRLLSIANSLIGKFATDNFNGRAAPIFNAALQGFASVVAAQGSVNQGYSGPNFLKLLGERANNDPEYPKKVMDGLVQALELGTVFTIKTYMSKTLYTNMVMTNLSYDHEPTTGKSLNFTMSARQVTTALKFKESIQEGRTNAFGASATAPKGQSVAVDADPPDSIGLSSAWEAPQPLR